MCEVKRHIEKRKAELAKNAAPGPSKRVTTRLTPSQYDALVEMSELLQVSPTGLAETLLEAAILDAYPEVMP